MKLNYNAPTVEVIEVEVEGIMAYSTPKGDGGNAGQSANVSIEKQSAPESLNLGGFSRGVYDK